jgi:hypothetical protein
VVIAVVAVVFSAAAVALVALPSLSPLPALSRLAESFASPGDLLWWATIGGAFAGRPTGLIGIAVWVLGTALFWFLTFLGTFALVSWLRALGAQRRH